MALASDEAALARGGTLVIDKPRGPTSFDMVARARRVLRTREVGHAGTLDPMATGVLVLAFGEGTKLVPYLTAASKRYVADVALGVETDSLDADGVVTRTEDVPRFDEDTLERIRATLLDRTEQIPPMVSALKVDGERLYEKARRGEQLELPPREVRIHALTITPIDERSIRLEVEASKGFYVRALARDVAAELGTLGHLTALRRLASGALTIDQAIDGSLLGDREHPPTDEARERVRAHVRALEASVGDLVAHSFEAPEVAHVTHGRAFPAPEALAEARTPIACFDEAGRLIAVAEVVEGLVKVRRGFR